MRSQPSRVIVFLVSFMVVLATILIGISLLLFRMGSNNQELSQVTVTSTNNVIMRENAHPGTTSWEIPQGKEALTQIQAYASATSVLPGQVLTFYVSTQIAFTPYSVDIYRLGWYGGLGGRLMSSQANLIGHSQGYYDTASSRLIGCISCLVDTRTGLVEADWQPSYTLTIPSDWTTGVYLAKFTDTNGMQTYVPFDVRGNFTSSYVAVTSDTTYAAYNDWGGYSLYRAYNSTGDETNETGGKTKGVKVSFDRPYAKGGGSGFVLLFEADAIHWLERQGYDLSYISSVDLHEDPAQLLQHRVYLSLGHDEYWTKEMRDGVENARNHGVSLAFLGADDAYWQMRFEPDSKGTRDRTIVCYKVETWLHNLADDPLYGKDNTRVTTLWRDPLLARPENALIGIMYSNDIQTRQGFPWRVDPQAKSSFLDGTGLQAGHLYGCDLVGYEWDRIFTNGFTPAGLQVLGISSTADNNNNPDFSNTTYYIARSGAMVFATGSINWTASLDDFRLSRDPLCIDQSPVIPGMQKLMEHMMNALLSHSHS